MLCICVLPGFICVCGCSCTCLSMHVEVHGCAYVYMHGFTCVCRCSCTCLSVHMCVCVYAHAPVWACMGGRRLLLGIVLLHFPTFVRLSRSNSGLTDMVSLGSQLVLGVPPLYPLTGQPPHAPGVLCGFLGTQSLVRKLAWPMFRLLSHLPRTMQSGTFTGNNFTI